MNSLNSRRSFIKKGLLASSFFTMSSFNSFEIGNKIIENTKKTAGNVSMYAVFFFCVC